MFARLCRPLIGYRELLLALTYRDIRVKYKQAALGISWAFFMPLMAISSGVVFRVAMALFSGQDPALRDIVGVMVKTLPWLMFARIVAGSSNSLVSNKALITKIYFPRQVVPLSCVLSVLFDLSISMTGLLIALFVLTAGWPDLSPVVVSWWLLSVPLFLLLLFVLALGLGLLLSAANLLLRDVGYVVGVLLQFGIFFSLVFFTYEEMGSWGWPFMINPVAGILEGMRHVVLLGEIQPYLWKWLIYSTAFSLVSLVVGAVFFERAEYLFAEYA